MDSNERVDAKLPSLGIKAEDEAESSSSPLSSSSSSDEVDNELGQDGSGTSENQTKQRIKLTN